MLKSSAYEQIHCNHFRHRPALPLVVPANECSQPALPWPNMPVHPEALFFCTIMGNSCSCPAGRNNQSCRHACQQLKVSRKQGRVNLPILLRTCRLCPGISAKTPPYLAVVTLLLVSEGSASSVIVLCVCTMCTDQLHIVAS